jgi:hypothetical protein
MPPDLALDGDAIRRIIAPAPEASVGEALRWLESQVDDNPQLNTPEALSALLRFRAVPSRRADAPDRRHAGRPRTSSAVGDREGAGTAAASGPAARGRADHIRARVTAEGEVDLKAHLPVLVAEGAALDRAARAS